jgi:hypothetical protein
MLMTRINIWKRCINIKQGGIRAQHYLSGHGIVGCHLIEVSLWWLGTGKILLDI